VKWLSRSFRVIDSGFFTQQYVYLGYAEKTTFCKKCIHRCSLCWRKTDTCLTINTELLWVDFVEGIRWSCLVKQMQGNIFVPVYANATSKKWSVNYRKQTDDVLLTSRLSQHGRLLCTFELLCFIQSSCLSVYEGITNHLSAVDVKRNFRGTRTPVLDWVLFGKATLADN